MSRERGIAMKQISIRPTNMIAAKNIKIHKCTSDRMGNGLIGVMHRVQRTRFYGFLLSGKTRCKTFVLEEMERNVWVDTDSL